MNLMSKLTNGTDLGAIKPKAPEPAKTLRIPSRLRGRIIDCFGSETSGFGYQASCDKYGIWKCRARRGCRFFGHDVAEGQTLELPGNVAVEAAMTGIIEFTDERIEEEEAA